MQNYSDYETERRLATLENKIAAQYNDAYRELLKTCNEYFKKFEERYQKEYAAYQNGEYTDAEFKAWVKAQIARGEHWNRLRENAALRITKANETAASYINDTTPSIWTLNYNYTAYQADKAMGISFDIYDENTVRRLIVEDPKLLPSISQKAIDRAKDTAWNRNQFTKDVTSGILQGKSPTQLAKTIKHTMGLNQVSAIRNARTAITSAQNGGRMDGYDKLASMGVQMQKEWMATLDGRTRDSHRDLDGERVPYDEPFSNGLMFPADPQGAGREVWNCRCTMRAIFPENNEPRKMTYYGRNAEEAFEKWEKDTNNRIATYGRTTDKWLDSVRYGIIADRNASINRIEKGTPMSHKKADSGQVNPHAGEAGGKNNCQTCAIVYETRRKGYPVVALPFDSNNSKMSDLCYDMTKAFIDPIFGTNPKEVPAPKDTNNESDYVKYLESLVAGGERYILRVAWNGEDYGHAMNLDRDKNGRLRVTDNQTDNPELRAYTGGKLMRMLHEVDFSPNRLPSTIRVDNMDINREILKAISEEEQ